MGREVDAAEGVEAQAPSRAGLGKAPDRQRRGGVLGDLHGHGGVREGDLQEEEHVEGLPFQARERGLGGRASKSRPREPTI
jgi:hypothetical protein